LMAQMASIIEREKILIEIFDDTLSLALSILGSIAA